VKDNHLRRLKPNKINISKLPQRPIEEDTAQEFSKGLEIEVLFLFA